jgi:glycosyltransferase involved in cell wall biosynthesis
VYKIAVRASGARRAAAADVPGTEAGDAFEVSVVVPCLDEARTLPEVIRKAGAAFAALGLRGEVVVADNGSTDGSVEIAERLGARVVHCTARGYGNALRHGLAAARGRWLVMGDADDTYDFEQIGPFVGALRDGADVVMGTRLPPGRILPGANPWLNRNFGTPALTFVLNRLFGTRIRDANCGMRALTREAFDLLALRAEGMEFASEMIMKAGLHGVRIDEVPVTLHPDRRGRRPHLRRWRDGWRHLEFMLLHAPDQLLFFPGLVGVALGLLLILPVAFGPRHLFGRLFDFHYLFYGGALVLVGLQGVMGALLVRDVVGGVIMRPNRFASALSAWLSFARGLVAGGALFAAGLALELWVLGVWIGSGFGPMNEPRRSVLGMLLLAVGTEVAVFAFLHGVLRKHLGSRAAAPR